MSSKSVIRQLEAIKHIDLVSCLVPGAEIIADEAKSVVHVVSGALKDSIGVEEYNDRVLVAARIDYAATEEFREGGHAYLRPSIDSMSNKADEAIAETVEKKIKEAI